MCKWDVRSYSYVFSKVNINLYVDNVAVMHLLLPFACCMMCTLVICKGTICSAPYSEKGYICFVSLLLVTLFVIFLEISDTTWETVDSATYLNLIINSSLLEATYWEHN